MVGPAELVRVHCGSRLYLMQVLNSQAWQDRRAHHIAICTGAASAPRSYYWFEYDHAYQKCAATNFGDAGVPEVGGCAFLVSVIVFKPIVRARRRSGASADRDMVGSSVLPSLGIEDLHKVQSAAAMNPYEFCRAHHSNRLQCAFRALFLQPNLKLALN